MNTHRIALLLAAAGTVVSSEAVDTVFTNFVRQVQVASGAEWDVDVTKAGDRLSELAIDPGGARFELWTINGDTLSDYLLDQVYVGTYVPQATVEIVSEDPYSTIPRTRADRPFRVTLTLNGMSTDPSAPPAAQMVDFEHYLQSYGEDGTGLDINRDDATLAAESLIASDGTYTFDYTLTTVPGDDRSKVRGEERFTVMSLPDYQAPPSVLASRYVQIWPVADASIIGVADGDKLRFSTPKLTFELNDLYPNSRTYAQVYKGPSALGTTGMVIPGSALVVNDAVPQDRVLSVENWDSVIKDSGVWTMEVLTETPFGIDRLAHVTFNVNRDLRVNGTVTTVE